MQVRGSSHSAGTRKVLLIDGWQHPDVFRPGLRLRGAKTHHFRTQATAPSETSAKPRETIHPFTNYYSLRRYAEAHQIELVLPGSDHGAQLTDALNRDLGLPGHNSRYTLDRSNKWYMGQRLHNLGLRPVAQFRAQRPKAAIAWAKQQGYPVYAKPLTGSGSHLVFRCHDSKALHNACLAIISASPDSTALIETELPGTEYQVGHFSFHGAHTVTHAWRIVQTPADRVASVYSAALLLQPSSDEFQRLQRYCQRSCNALGFFHGIGHSEVKLHNDNAVLVEAHARPMGGRLPYLYEAANNYTLGYSSKLIAAYLAAPHEAPELPRVTAPWSALQIFIQAAGRGRIRWPIADLKARLAPGVAIESSLRTWPENKATVPTRDIHTVIGSIGLVGPSDAHLLSSLHMIRGLEREGYFETHPFSAT